MAELWVLNASPLIVLARVGQWRLLDLLSPGWAVPEAVVWEVKAGPSDDPARKLIEELGIARQCRAAVPEAIAVWDLDAGESQVLGWAYEHPEYTAIVDDRAARVCASVFGIRVLGTIGVLVRARRAGLIAELRPVLAGLRAAGVRTDSRLEAEALRLVGE